MADAPVISSLMMGAVLGDLGERAEQVEVRRCPAEWPYQIVTALDYRFDFWNGEDFLEVMGQYAVSERLRRTMEEVGIRGVEFRPMATSTAPGFAISERAYARSSRRSLAHRAARPGYWATGTASHGRAWSAIWQSVSMTGWSSPLRSPRVFASVWAAGPAS
jgi:hypothetical protein